MPARRLGHFGYKHLKKRKPISDERNAYKLRDELLLKLGFVGYTDYLRSPLWKDIRKKKLAECPKCETCNAIANQVHHISYMRNTLKGKNMAQLVAMCDDCHRKVEFDSMGRKRSFSGARNATKRLLKKVGKWPRGRGRAKVTRPSRVTEIPQWNQ